MTEVICFTGAQGTGKSTMRRALVSHLEKKGIAVIDHYSNVTDSISRYAAREGFPINEDTDWISQYYIACSYIVHDLETRLRAKIHNYEYVVLDRSVLDSIPYVMVADKVYHGEKKLIKELLFNHFEMFPSQLYYCEPLKKIVPDGTRSISKVFQGKVQAEFKKLIDVLTKKNYDVVILNNESVEKRLDYILMNLDLG